MHRTSFATAVVLTVALSLHARSARAEGDVHDGFQFRGAVGLGYMSVSETGDATLHGGAGTLEAYVGGMPIRGLAIGGLVTGTWAIGPSVSVNGFTASDSDTSLSLITIGPYVDFYPNPRKGFHILGTLGFASLTASYDDGNFSASSSASGFTTGFGIGYDWWVSRDWSLGILGRFTFATTSRDVGPVSVSESVFVPAVLFSFSYN